MKPLHVYFDSSFQIPQLDGLSDDQETDDEFMDDDFNFNDLRVLNYI